MVCPTGWRVVTRCSSAATWWRAVPVAILDKLLSEGPKIKGISLPCMPDGSPGMTGSKSEPFTIYEISDEPKVYAVD